MAAPLREAGPQPRTAIVAISRHGAAQAHRLAAALAGDKTLYVDRRFLEGSEPAIPFDLPVRPLLEQLFSQYQRLVLFMALGAAVRLLAPCLQHKHHDPAVVCVDDGGRFAVSLLSGHLGGADRLAQEVAEILGGTPVVTSASHVGDTLAVDLLGESFGWRLEAEPLAVTRASAAVVNGEPVGIYQEAGEPDWWPPLRALPDNIQLYPSLPALAAAPCVAALLITDRLAGATGEASGYAAALKDKVVVLYRPRSLVVGMGCRRGVPREELEGLLVDTFREHHLALASLRCVATAELKRDEPGLRQLAEKYGVPLYCLSAAELNSVFQPQPEVEDAAVQGTQASAGLSAQPSGLGPTPSSQAYRLLGLWGVAEPAALLVAGSRELLVPRKKTARATIAVARMVFQGAAGPTRGFPGPVTRSGGGQPSASGGP